MQRLLDFDVVVESHDDGYRTHVVASPAGEAQAGLVLPFTDKDLRILVLEVVGSIGRLRRSVRRIESQDRQVIEDFGDQLFRALFSGPVGECLGRSRMAAASKDAGLRIRLRLPGTLANIPWEYLYDPEHGFLGLDPETALVRYLELPAPVRPFPVSPPLRILAMISAPSDVPRLETETEWGKLNDTLGDLVRRGLVEVDRLESGTLAALQRPLRLGEYHVLHFIGHGGYDENAQDGALALEDADGKTRLVTGRDLGMMIRQHRSLRLVVLNACEGARNAQDDPFGGVAQALVRQGIPAVIAMQFEISDPAALAFSQSFYQAIADRLPVDLATVEARRAMFAEGNEIEWATPVLYLRSTDGRVFTRGRSPQAEPGAREQAGREARERAEQETRERAEQETRERAEQEARERAEQEARERAERQAREEARKQARLEAWERAERQAREEARERARLEAERQAREQAEREAREEAGWQARERPRLEAERQAGEQAQLEAERQAPEPARPETGRQAREEAEWQARGPAGQEAGREAREEAEQQAGDRAQETKRLPREVAKHRVRFPVPVAGPLVLCVPLLIFVLKFGPHEPKPWAWVTFSSAALGCVVSAVENHRRRIPVWTVALELYFVWFMVYGIIETNIWHIRARLNGHVPVFTILAGVAALFSVALCIRALVKSAGKRRTVHPILPAFLICMAAGLSAAAVTYAGLRYGRTNPTLYNIGQKSQNIAVVFLWLALLLNLLAPILALARRLQGKPG